MFLKAAPALAVPQTMILERLHHIGSCRAAADDANMFLCLSYAGRCAVGDTRSVGWKSEHRQRSGAKHFP